MLRHLRDLVPSFIIFSFFNHKFSINFNHFHCWFTCWKDVTTINPIIGIGLFCGDVF